MKKNILNCLSAAILAFTLTMGAGAADVVEEKTTTTTTTSEGTISDFGTDRLIIKTEKEPLTYSYTKTTTYVDETGAPVSVELVKSGLPVTIYYTKVGDKMVASKVIVRKVTKTEVK